jgi:RNA polymerase sigma-70 factor (ECF subfamily)
VPVLPAADDSPDATASLFDLIERAGPGPDAIAEGEELRRLVRVAVDELPDLLRQVVVLTYFQGLKYQDAADILGVPLGTVKSRLHAALVKLTECWHKLVPADEGDQIPTAVTANAGRP